MPNITLTPAPCSAPLPPSPSIAHVRASLGARLDWVRGQLPTVQQRRAFLERVWYSEEPDAALIFVNDGVAIPCDPAGADRLASAVADEQALLGEESALCELEAAIEIYDAGGHAVQSQLDEEGDGAVGLREVRLSPHPETIRARHASHLEYALDMRTYLAALRRELHVALGAGDHDRTAALAAERGALRERVEADRATRSAPRLAAMRGTPLSDALSTRKAAKSA